MKVSTTYELSDLTRRSGGAGYVYLGYKNNGGGEYHSYFGLAEEDYEALGQPQQIIVSIEAA